MEVVLVHGLLGHPKNAWFPWLMSELETRGIGVRSLEMPNPAIPDRDAWVATVRDAITDPSRTILVGHSLGCAAILQAVADMPPASFPRIILVAGFGRPFMKALEPWFPSPLDLDRIRQVARSWTVIHSTDDLLVPYEEGMWIADRLRAHLVTKRNGHFRARENAKDLPEVLDAIVTVTEEV
ncbi:alpha/beta fold hydrolase [Candidatus Uhrbacteria bacterium]|nr:alpha/beta fold hydrolase [Candidatus Uhrbacteria bacterium]